jgi:SAM-dependent methyltransferase
VDRLLDRGFTNITVADVSATALQRARARLGARAPRVQWVVGDLRELHLARPADVWHDRAVLHFLTSAEDQDAYVASLRRNLRAGGHAILATFAADGPTMCSGLPVARYDAPSLAARLGPEFELVRASVHAHPTPKGTEQRLQYTLFRRRPAEGDSA